MIYKEIRCRWLNRNVLYAARHKSSLSLWLYNNLLPLNVHVVLCKTPVSVYILVLYIYKQFKSGLAAPPLGEVTRFNVYTYLPFPSFSFHYLHYLQSWKNNTGLPKILEPFLKIPMNSMLIDTYRIYYDFKSSPVK